MLRFAALAFGAIMAGALSVGAADYPSKPIRIIVPFPPGAFNDTLARTLGPKLNERWGQPVVVDNRPGAGSVIGTDLAAKAPADGHTLLVASFAFAVNPSLHASLPYDSAKDFTPVVLAAATPNFLVVSSKVPASTLKEFIALAKAKPGDLNYASAGNGTSNHLCMELLKRMAGIDLVHVPYKGSAPAVLGLLGGEVDAMFNNAPNVLSQMKAGQLRALGVSTPRRSALAPDVPTIAEAGVPGYEVEVSFGILAPAGTPKEVIAKLNSEINRVLASPKVKASFAEQGVHTVGGSPEHYGAYLREETAKWAKVVKNVGVHLD